MPGSSPLTRGKPAHFAFLSCLTGLIPAHAGKTLGTVGPGGDSQAHPRSRGENAIAAYWYTENVGSSPLTRGKRAERSRCPRRRGLIPAHAGKTRAVPRPADQQWAHPRSRGENAYSKCAGDAQSGSSPLTRGKLKAWGGDTILTGLIPAHAGKTRVSSNRLTRPWAHPRSRGENSWWSALPCHAAGSSPLTRGKPAKFSVDLNLSGLIPAHAGKTASPPRCQA